MAWLKKIIIDENQRKTGTHLPFFIPCVSIIDIALVIYTIVYNGGLSPMSENAMAGPSALTLIRNGAKFVPCMKPTQADMLQHTLNCYPVLSLTNKTSTYEECLWYACNVASLRGFPYQFYRFFIPIFLHGGIIHLVLNLIAQLSLGIPLERKFGAIRIFVMYVLSGIGGALLSAIGLSRNAGVGASGAIMGILAVRIVDSIRSWRDLPRPWLQISIDIVTAIISLLLGIFVPIVDYMAHIGGFLMGILTSLLICPNLYWNICKSDDPLKPRLIIMGISFVFILAFFLGGFVGFFQTNSPIVFTSS